MQADRYTIPLATDASGDCTAYSPNLSGRILQVQYVKTDFANGVDLTITAEATGQAILTLTDQNAAAVFFPRTQVHGNTGTGLTMDGTRLLVEPVVLAADRVKIVVAQGGNVKTGYIVLIVG